LIRALPRAFRRNDVPLFYSAGFHPKPDMTFAPALSLGVASLAEVVDVKLTCDVDPSTLLDVLSASAPDGLRFVGAARLGGQDAAVSRVIDAARYVVGFPRKVLAERGGDAWLEEQVARARDAKELRLLRRIDGIGKWVDVREFVRALRTDDASSDEGARALRAAGFIGDLLPLVVDVEIRGSGAVKIAEVVEALAPSDPLPHRAVRVAMGTWKDGAIASPLDLAAVRKNAPREAVAAPA